MRRDEVTLLVHGENIVIVTAFYYQIVINLAYFLGYSAVINLFIDFSDSVWLGGNNSVNHCGSVVFVDFCSHHSRLEKARIVEIILNLTF